MSVAKTEHNSPFSLISSLMRVNFTVLRIGKKDEVEGVNNEMNRDSTIVTKKLLINHLLNKLLITQKKGSP
jgi:hypothetical protein